jgi:ribonuclease HI
VPEPYVLHTDGGARGNPGPAGAAFVLKAPGGDRLCAGGRFLGETTNNVAEYEALLLGLRAALERDARPLVVHSDSELLVRQVGGEYKVKNHDLKRLHAEASRLLSMLGEVRIVHVRRHENAEADALANAAMEARSDVGEVPQSGSSAGQSTLFGGEK